MESIDELEPQSDQERARQQDERINRSAVDSRQIRNQVGGCAYESDQQRHAEDGDPSFAGFRASFSVTPCAGAGAAAAAMFTSFGALSRP
jgi:hypothetical protein